MTATLPFAQTGSRQTASSRLKSACDRNRNRLPTSDSLKLSTVLGTLENIRLGSCCSSYIIFQRIYICLCANTLFTEYVRRQTHRSSSRHSCHICYLPQQLIFNWLDGNEGLALLLELRPRDLPGSRFHH